MYEQTQELVKIFEWAPKPSKTCAKLVVVVWWRGPE